MSFCVRHGKHRETSTMRFEYALMFGWRGTNLGNSSVQYLLSRIIVVGLTLKAEMVQPLKALIALPGDASSIPSTYMVADSHLCSSSRGS